MYKSKSSLLPLSVPVLSSIGGMMRRKRSDEDDDERCEGEGTDGMMESAPSPSRLRPTPRTEPAVASASTTLATSSVDVNSGDATGGIGGSVARRRPPSPEEEDGDSSSEDENSDCPISYVPQYLRQIIRPYHSDFFVTSSHSPRLVAQLMSEGFLPIATRRYLLPKLHARRCCISLPDGLHVSKSVRKKSKRWCMSINTDFDGVVKGCHEQHGINWLYPPVVAAFKVMNHATISADSGSVSVSGSGGDGGGGVGGGIPALLFSPPDSTSPDPRITVPVRLYSIEVNNVTTGTLAAGELGYTVGSVYTSLTGFSNEDGAGSVQLSTLGTLLGRCGFDIWDMGMHMDYKERMGARLVRRGDYVDLVRRVRVDRSGVVLRLDAGVAVGGGGGDDGRMRVNCKEILSGGGATAAAAVSVPAPGSGQAPGPAVAMGTTSTANADEVADSKPAAAAAAEAGGGGICHKKSRAAAGDDGGPPPPPQPPTTPSGTEWAIGGGEIDGDPVIAGLLPAQHSRNNHHHHHG